MREAPPLAVSFDGVRTDRGVATDQLALVMPTSLCSGQVARLIAEDLDANPPPWSDVSRFVALVHTEGCGSNNAAELYLRTMLGHLVHRSVRHAVLLEHGCEQIHNDAVRHYLAERGFSADEFGWASVQMDGGIARVQAKVAGQLEAMAAAARAPGGGSGASDAPGDGPPALARETAGAEELRVALAANGPLLEAAGEAFGRLAAGLVAAGATVVVPDNAGLLGSRAFREAVLPDAASVPTASLAFGEPADEAGFHLMEAPTENPVETFTGLGATGVEVMLCHVGRTSLQAHPMIPLVQVTADASLAERYAGDLDLVLTLDRSAGGLVGELAALVADAASRRYRPKLWSRGVTEFQLTRGRLGLSM